MRIVTELLVFVTEPHHEGALVVSTVREKFFRLSPGDVSEVPDLALLPLLAAGVCRVEVEPGGGALHHTLPHQGPHLPPHVETVVYQGEPAGFITQQRLDLMVCVQEVQRHVLLG